VPYTYTLQNPPGRKRSNGSRGHGLGHLPKHKIMSTQTPHQVIPRKHRPKTFDDLVGQETTTRCFLSMIHRDYLPHAILLCGTRGVGKTSTARIFAKALHCSNRSKVGNPCGTCSDCTQVESGHHLDVLEIDGASNNGVDAIRELRETAYYLPTQGKHKVYIIDEVHMLSTSAFNALLKILEEPPPHLIFVFATTEPTQLPATILSRVMRFDFHPIKTTALATHLTEVVRLEKRSMQAPAINKIAALGNGSMRDAQMLLEQVFMYFEADKTISLDDLRELFSIISQDKIYDLLEQIGQENTPKALELLTALYQDGHDPSTIALEIQRALRQVLLTQSAPSVIEKELDFAPEQVKILKRLISAPGFAQEALLMMFQTLLKTLQVIRYAEHPQWVLEACVIQLSKVRLWMNPSQKIDAPMTSRKSSDGAAETEQRSNSPSDDFLDLVSTKDPVLYGLIQSCKVTVTDQEIQIQKTNNAFTFEKLKDKRNVSRLVQVCQQTPFDGRKIDYLEQAAETTPQTPLTPDLKERRERLINHPVVKAIKRDLKAEVTKVIENQNIVSTED
jgi:DNA polymerase III subunit gamma/tau